MNQRTFIRHGEPRWRDLEVVLAGLETGGKTAPPTFPRLYRTVCHDLALARERQLDAHLIDRLNRLALRGHQQLYRPRTGSWSRLRAFWLSGFPAAVQRELPVAALAACLFYGAALIVGAFVYWQPELVFAMMDGYQVSQLETMYDPSSAHLLRPRTYETDAAMFGFYVAHNIGIGFRTFAGGIFAGLGSVFFLIFNGVFLGAVAAHLTNVGYGATFWPFVIGHAALELQALVIAAAAGLRLGWPLISPGRSTRIEALRLGAARALPLIYGSASMLLLAACIEAFWSATTWLPTATKLGVGAGLWVLVFIYLLAPRGTDGA